jgi:iron complex transport system ATP-binding protein
MLTLEDVRFAFGDRAVLAGVSLAVARGEIVCVVGANGAGKTTLLRLAAGFLRPGGGRVRVGDVDPQRTPRRLLARRLAFLPQEYHLAFPFTVGEVVLMGRYPHQATWALESRADATLAEEAMRRCDVLGLAGRRFDALSGGERRRALLAQAFCQAADLVLLDEPTAALDPAHALAVFRILEEEKAARGAAALVVTHDLNLAGRFADRVVVLDAGRVATAGPPRAVLASAATGRAFGISLHVGALADGTPYVVPDASVPVAPGPGGGSDGGSDGDDGDAGAAGRRREERG